MDKPVNIVDRPRYMQAFACVGPACEEHCCQGWRVHLDRTTYKRYQEIRLDSLRDRLQTHLERHRDDKRSDRRYGLLRNADDGVCPMLDRETRLCDVQSKLGASYLSETCDTYPRTRQQRGRRQEEFAALSCPEAARLALLAPDALDRVPAELRPIEGTGAAVDADPVRAHAEAIYETACALLRSDSLTPSEALIAVGVIVRKPRALRETMPDTAHGPALLTLLARMLQPAAIAAMRDSVAGLPSSRDFHQAMLTAMHEGYKATMSPRPRFKAVLEDCSAGLGLDDGDREAQMDRFEAARETWFEPFDRAHPWLLRNYLLNDLGRTGFPGHGAAGIEVEYMHLAVRFAMVKLYLVGVAAHRREAFDADDYVRVIQAFSRNVEHSGFFVPHLIERLAKAGLNSVASAALLLR